MEILNNYLEYRKNKPKYAEWHTKRQEDLAKKEQYLKEHPLTREQKDELVQKASVVLNAVDTMDEFSQSKAENTEIATDAITSFAISIAMLAGMGIGTLFMKSKGGKAQIEKFAKKHPDLAGISTLIPSMAGAAVSLPFVAPIVTWATKNQIFASKIGRHEAVKGELASENQFAIFDKKQEEELNKKAENIEIKDEKTEQKAALTLKEAKATVTGLMKDNEEVKAYLKAQNEQFEKEKENFDKPLDNTAIQNAKEEREMITRVVEEIDKASQDYAEDVEFGTNTLMASGALLGALAGFIARGVTALISKIKPDKTKIQETAKKASKGSQIGRALPLITTFIGMTVASIFATKLQKQASRVARFNVMQDFKDNPEKLAYVEEDKLKDIKAPKTEEKKKENLFSFYKRLFKDNREYNKYIKENGKKDKQLKLAKNEIELTEKQKTDAKQLQENVIKTFNKIDDKSQTYSESTEALGAIVKEYGSTFFSLGGAILSMVLTFKNAKKGTFSTKNVVTSLAPLFISLIPTVALDAYVTKEQKKSSRVAHMLAINDLEDYRHFANYNTAPAKDTAKETAKENNKETKTDEPKEKVSVKNTFSPQKLNGVFEKFNQNKSGK